MNSLNTDKLKELQYLYNNPLTTNTIKKEAWNIKGIKGYHFRLMVRGYDTNGKQYSDVVIQECIDAIKQAYINDAKKRNQFITEKVA